MEFIRETTINKPINEVWDVLGNQFTDAYKWASSLNHSQGFGKPTIEGATCSNRACDIKGMGKIKESIRVLDHKNHILSYEVIEGFPSFVKSGINTWTLKAIGNQTHLHMKCDMVLKGFVGTVMSPMMRMQMNGIFNEVVEEFKYYVEHNGTPHPRKIKAIQKLAKKAA